MRCATRQAAARRPVGGGGGRRRQQQQQQRQQPSVRDRCATALQLLTIATAAAAAGAVRPAVAAADAPKHTVTVDSGHFAVDGHPYFPVGFYYLWDSRHSFTMP
eukprot:SAG22_NODE_9015_length_614_cov_1.207767_1_plen_103_part_10